MEVMQQTFICLEQDCKANRVIKSIDEIVDKHNGNHKIIRLGSLRDLIFENEDINKYLKHNLEIEKMKQGIIDFITNQLNNLHPYENVNIAINLLKNEKYEKILKHDKLNDIIRIINYGFSEDTFMRFKILENSIINLFTQPIMNDSIQQLQTDFLTENNKLDQPLLEYAKNDEKKEQKKQPKMEEQKYVEEQKIEEQIKKEEVNDEKQEEEEKGKVVSLFTKKIQPKLEKLDEEKKEILNKKIKKEVKKNEQEELIPCAIKGLNVQMVKSETVSEMRINEISPRRGSQEVKSLWPQSQLSSSRNNPRMTESQTFIRNEERKSPIPEYQKSEIIRKSPSKKMSIKKSVSVQNFSMKELIFKKSYAGQEWYISLKRIQEQWIQIQNNFVEKQERNIL